MILPLIIKIVFVLGMVAILLAFPLVFASLGSEFSIARLFGGAVLSFFGTILNLILWRVTCEWPIVLFTIHESLSAMMEARG
jgi:hypothetical protein